MELLDRVTTDAHICHGKPCIRHLRYPVFVLLDLMAGGQSNADILADFPALEPDDLRACLAYAARLTNLGAMPVAMAA